MLIDFDSPSDKTARALMVLSIDLDELTEAVKSIQLQIDALVERYPIKPSCAADAPA